MLAQSSDLPVAPVKDAQFHGKYYLLWHVFRQRDHRNSKIGISLCSDLNNNNNSDDNNMHISVL